MKINYHKKTEEEISKILKSGEKQALLLHSCCAPCSSYVLEYLSGFFEITVYFYGPNIYPESEYFRREAEQQDLIKLQKLESKVKFIKADYDSAEFYEVAKGFEKERERGARCSRCFQLRLERTYEFAKANGFDYFTTTLSISPHKDAQLINKIGELVSADGVVKFLQADFKKNEGYKRSLELSQEYGLYRQDYCGCEFSKKEREEKS